MSSNDSSDAILAPTNWWQRYMALADTEGDSEETRLKHRFMILMGSLMGLGGLTWGSTCAWAGLWFASTMPFGYTAITIVNFGILARYKNYRSARVVQVAASILLPFTTQWALGGTGPSGAVMYWGMVGLIGALSFEEVRSSIRWLIFFLLLAIFSAYLEYAHLLPTHAELSGQNLSLILLTSTFCVVSSAIFVFTWYFVRERHHAIETLEIRNEQLLASQREAEAASRREAEANEAKSRFLAMVSHEIRTPLNGVIGLTNLALSDEMSSRQRSNLTDALTSADDLLTIINDLLDFSKIEAGKLELEHVEFQLDSVLDNIARVAGTLATNKGIEFVMRVADASPVLVGDPTRLGQAVLNLTSNAIKFTDRGEVLLEAKTTPSQAGRVSLEITVHDTGPGIDAETQKRLFQPFTQADESTTRRFGGTGLGLSITRNLVESMSGRIWLDSAPGSGSTFGFIVNLPARDVPPNRDPRALGRSLHALVVDDNDSARDVLSSYLRNYSIDTDTVGSAEQALIRAAGARFDVILTDLQMPGMDGIKLIERLRANPALAETRLVLVTGPGGEHSEAEFMRAGADAVLHKPVRPSILFDTLLPLFENEVQDASAVSHQPPSLAGVRILIVEDNDINQKILIGLLGQVGAEIAAANDGKAGVAAMENAKYKFDAVLMDVQMPVMDGFDATRAIRALGYATPIIGVTAHALSESRSKCLEAGMDEVITKPIKPHELFSAIARRLERPIDDQSTFDKSTPAAVLDEAGEAPLPNAPGVNMHDGLARAGGNESLYRELLRRFCIEHLDTAKDISALIDAGNQDQARRRAHTLKGVAGNIGAEQVASAADRLEKALTAADSGPSVKVSLAELEQALAVIESGRPILEAASADRGKSSMPADLTRLRNLITDSDPEALDTFLSMRTTLMEEHSHKLVQSLGNALEDYDFDRALHFVDALVE